MHTHTPSFSDVGLQIFITWCHGRHQSLEERGEGWSTVQWQWSIS